MKFVWKEGPEQAGTLGRLRKVSGSDELSEAQM
jgi:hypothetical protein